jgi:hypothetical protein
MYICILGDGEKPLLHRNCKASPEPFLTGIEPYRDDIVVGVEWMPALFNSRTRTLFRTNPVRNYRLMTKASTPQANRVNLVLARSSLRQGENRFRSLPWPSQRSVPLCSRPPCPPFFRPSEDPCWPKPLPFFKPDPCPHKQLPSPDIFLTGPAPRPLLTLLVG